jgi:hypothetical protein
MRYTIENNTIRVFDSLGRQHMVVRGAGLDAIRNCIFDDNGVPTIFDGTKFVAITTEEPTE